MIIWNKRLYCTEVIKPQLKEIKKKIEKPDKLRHGAYLVTISEDGAGILEIYDILFFPVGLFSGTEKNITIVGVAENKERAKELSCAIITRVYKDTGAFEIGRWLSDVCRDGSNEAVVV